MNGVGTATYPFADRVLAQRFERAEGMANRSFVEARARLQPEVGACWIERGGALAMFDGAASPLTQTFGLGMFEAPTEPQLEEFEALFRERGAAVNHETSPLADPGLLPLLAARGYAPIEYSNVLYRPIALPSADPNDAIQVTRVEPVDAARWARTAADGWGSEGSRVGEFVLGIGSVQTASDGFHGFLAVDHGRDIAAGGLFIHERIALLAGASTVPASRRRGAQFALLHARLRFASVAGCEVAMIAALPGSGSQRNAERHGFRVAYTRVKWSDSVPPVPGTDAGTVPGTDAGTVPGTDPGTMPGTVPGTGRGTIPRSDSGADGKY